MLLNRTIRNSGYTVMGQIVNLSLGLLFAGMTIRYLGYSLAGFFLLANSILGWAQLGGGGSLNAPAVQRIAFLISENNWLGAKKLVRTISTANLGINLPFALVSIIVFPLLFSWSKIDMGYYNQALWVMIILAITFLVDQWGSSLRTVYEALQRFDLINFTLVFFGLIGNLIKLYILFKYHNIVYLAFTYFFISSTKLLVDMVLVNRLIKGCFILGWERGILKPLYSFGFWSWIGNISNVLFFNILSLILVKYLGSSSLPYISLPQNIVVQIGTLIAGSSYIIFPTLAGQGKKVLQEVIRVEDRLRWFIATISIGVYGGLFFLGPELLTFLVDKNFAVHATVPLNLYCIYGVAWAMTLALYFSTMAMGKVKINAIVELGVSVLSLVTALILIPIYGFIGVCISQLWKLPGAIVHTVLCKKILLKNESFIKIWSPYKSPLIGFVMWAIIVFTIGIFSSSLIIKVIATGIGFLTYILTIWYLETKFYSIEERWSTMNRTFDLIKSKISIKI